MKQLAFIIISSTPSLKNMAQNLSHYFRQNELVFIILCISTLHKEWCWAIKKSGFLGGPTRMGGPN